MLSALRTAVDEVVDVDPAVLDDVVLADDVVGIRAQIDRLEGQFAAPGPGRASAGPGFRGWLAVDGRVGAPPCDGPLPGTGRAWRAGEITAGATRTIIGARVAGHDARLTNVEPLLLDLAGHRQDRELRRACAHFRNLATADGVCPREHDGLSISRTYAGRTSLSADLSSDAAEVVVTAIHELTDPPADGDPRRPARRRADALVRMAPLAMASLPGTDPDGPSRARAAAMTVIDWTTLTDRVPGRLDGGFTEMLHPHDVDRLLCDCTVSRVVTGPDSLPIDVGRAKRTVPPALRRTLVVRDGGCRYPGCARPPGWTDAHHVVHWRNGGRTDLDNLVLLCDHHHHVVHQTHWVLKFDSDEMRVLKPDGAEIRGP